MKKVVILWRAAAAVVFAACLFYGTAVPSALAQEQQVLTPAENVKSGALHSRAPGNWVRRAIQQHARFNDRAFRATPSQRSQISISAVDMPSDGTSQAQPDFIPSLLANLFRAALDAITGKIKTLHTLINLASGENMSLDEIIQQWLSGAVSGDTGTTSEGIVVSLVADDDTLAVGEQTTVHVYVEQTSPSASRDNGIVSVALSIEVDPSGVVECQTPVTILSGWDEFIVGVDTGRSDGQGGIDRVVAGIDVLGGDRTEGLDGPAEVFNFTVKAVGAGTVEIVPRNYTSGGYLGVVDWYGQTGDEANYEPAVITVTAQ